MKSNYKNFGICLLILIFLMIGCDGASRITGHVYDSNNKPLENATVKFEAIDKGKPEESYQSTQQTDKQGKFDSMFMHAPFAGIPLRLTVSRSGYKTYQIEFTSDEAQRKLENKEEFIIVLEKSDLH